MHNMQERLQWASTFQGKYFNFLGYFFSLYCLWKICIVSPISYTVVILRVKELWFETKILPLFSVVNCFNLIIIILTLTCNTSVGAVYFI
jgi:hypothetical protein